VKVKNKTQSAGTSGQEAVCRFRIADFKTSRRKRFFPVGAAFPPASPERERWRAGSLDSNGFYDFYGFYDFNDLTKPLPFTIYDFYAFYDFNDLTNSLIN
jgi:hypothetical protein